MACDRLRLAIWGASGHALVVADIVRSSGVYEVAGFLDDVDANRHGAAFCGAEVLGGQEQLEKLLVAGIDQIILAIGDCAVRLRLSRVVNAKGFGCPSAVHPRATVAESVAIGPGTVIAAGAVINPGARLGAQVIVNTCASVDHECVIGDGAHLSPGVRLAGGVVIGEGAWVGIGATVIGGVRIGSGARIGAGAVVVRDIPDGSLAYGVPARVVKE